MIMELNSSHLEQCVDIAFQRNNQPENNSAYCPKSKGSIKADFEFLMSNPGNLMVGYFADDNLMGILGCFVNPENHWVDCSGPFFNADWSEDIAKEMLAFAGARLANAARFNFYFDTRNENLHRLMTRLSAERRDNEYHLLLKKADYTPQLLKHNIVRYVEKFENDVIQILHDTFPESYVSGRELIDSIGKDREVFCALDENGEFVGYGVLKRYGNETTHMNAEIFAVAEGARGKGYGWALLNAVISCALNDFNADTVDLIVDKLNTHARDLYYSCGFTLDVENASYCIYSVTNSLEKGM